MTAKENIEKIVRDSITPYKTSKRKKSDISVSSDDFEEIAVKKPTKKRLIVEKNEGNRLIYFLLIFYIIIGLIVILR